MFTTAARSFWKWPKEKQSIPIFNKYDWWPSCHFCAWLVAVGSFPFISKQLPEELQAEVTQRLQNSAPCQFHDGILLSSILI